MSVGEGGRLRRCRESLMVDRGRKGLRREVGSWIWLGAGVDGGSGIGR